MQEIGVVVLVSAAVFYLVWKFGFQGRQKPKPPRGPDVPLSRLRKSAREK